MSHRLAPPPSQSHDLDAHQQRADALCRPGGCGEPGQSAEQIHTHISTLLLTPTRVFKLKKPVRLGFVDFSTLALRREACEQELRLNRRTAPALYQGLVPVRLGADGLPCIVPLEGSAAPSPFGGAASLAPAPSGAEARVLDWAVQMRRFDQRQRLDRLAARGELQPAMIDALGRALARFHASLPPSPPGHGRPQTQQFWVRSNLQELAALVPAPWQPAVAALARWTDERGAELAPLMDQRMRTGHVRECHGDLHLANLAWVDGAPLIFDALEFNDTLRHTDTMGDLAFVHMDLQAAGLPALAWRLVSAVLEHSGDHAGLPLLTWWAVHRAAVRAKVALLASPARDNNEPAPADPRRPMPSDVPSQAAHYLQLATRLAGLPAQDLMQTLGAIDTPAQPPSSGARTPVPAPSPAQAATGLPAPRLVLMMGLSGAGKSTVATLVAERLGGIRLRADVERKRLFAIAPQLQAPAPAVAPALLYTAEANRRTYDRLAELATLALRCGVSVVVDAASLRRSERQALRALAARLGVRYALLLCEAPMPVLRQRVQQRLEARNDASDADTQVLSAQLDRIEWPDEDESAQLLRLETDCGPAELAERCGHLHWQD